MFQRHKRHKEHKEHQEHKLTQDIVINKLTAFISAQTMSLSTSLIDAIGGFRGPRVTSYEPTPYEGKGVSSSSEFRVQSSIAVPEVPKDRPLHLP
jgi:hypothetical protein